MRITRERVGTEGALIDCNGKVQCWQFICGDFSEVALALKSTYPNVIEKNREDQVWIAIPDTPVPNGRLFATLPTERITKLPFHINADFFPESDRKDIVFGDDPRSEWNRAAVCASAFTVNANLLRLKNAFRLNALAFWNMLGLIYDVYSNYKDNTRVPLGKFWDLLHSLRNSEIVYTESRKWFVPCKVRLTISNEEIAAAPLFQALGIELVHHDLREHYNILTAVGVYRLKVEDIYKSLEQNGMVGREPVAPQFKYEELIQLRKGIFKILERVRGKTEKQQSVDLLRQCILAQGVDGKFWPCGSVYNADQCTREIFIDLIPNNVSLLGEENDNLLKILCYHIDAKNAIELLECQNTKALQQRLLNGCVKSSDLLSWFDYRKSELNPELNERLACLPIFPSSKGNLCSLKNLHLPGGFEDPIGVTDLVDMNQIDYLSGFLQFLGAGKLSFEDYAMKYVPYAFSDDAILLKTKRLLIDTLTRRFSEIRENDKLKDRLRTTDIIECTNKKFMQPEKVYFSDEVIQMVFGNEGFYAQLPAQSEGRTDLYCWLGVTNRPRPKDIQRCVRELTARDPGSKRRQRVKDVLKAIGKLWLKFSEKEKASFHFLKGVEWLPSEGDLSRWHRPNRIYASNHKSLFVSQAQFLDLSVRTQRAIKDFLVYLGIQFDPQPRQVIDHLLECYQNNQKPPEGLYSWLNNHASINDLVPLLASPSLYNDGNYLHPKQVFWGQHKFGRFRIQLNSDFQTLQHLLSALDIRELPTYKDAIQVLKDISSEIKDNPLEAEDEHVVSQCWFMLAEGLQDDNERVSEKIKHELHNILCVVNKEKILHKPSLMYFEDRPGFAAKFDKIKHNIISRQIRIQTALEVAGVKPISKQIQGDPEYENLNEDKALKERIEKRIDLIKAIVDVIDDENNLNDIKFLRFFHTDKLEIGWRLPDWGSTESVQIETVSSYLEKPSRKLYFTYQNGNMPWSSIARELSLAIAPGEDLKAIAPGLKIVIESCTYDEALTQLTDLGISIPQEVMVNTENATNTSNDNALSSHPQILNNGADPNSPQKMERESKDDRLLTDGRFQKRMNRGYHKSSSTYQFISYIGVHPDEETDSETHKARMELENKAIEFILSNERDWKRTPPNNPGFDLYKTDQQGAKICWCEVKAMAGTLDNHLARMTKQQFETAQRHGQAYWLYVVENAGSESPKIIPINDPAGRARTFTFDSGWRSISSTSG